jgi:membrane protein
MPRLLARLLALLAAVSVIRRAARRDEGGTVTLAGGGPVSPPVVQRAPKTASGSAASGSRESAVTPRASAVTLLKRTAKRFQNERVSDNAAALTYFAVMAIVPSALVVISLVGIFVDDPNQAFVNTASLLGIEQDSQIGQNLQQFLELVTRNGSGAGLVLIFGLVTALWSFSGAMGALMAAVNRIWDVKETRNFAVRRLLAVGMSLLTAVVILVGIGAIALSAGLGDRLVTHYGLSESLRPIFTYVPYVVMLVLVSLYLAVVFWISPDKETRVWRWITVGAVVGTLVWLLATVGFAFYVSHVASYSKVYGKLAAVVIGLFWMYLSSVAILFGAAVDAEIERATPAGAEP